MKKLKIVIIASAFVSIGTAQYSMQYWRTLDSAPNGQHSLNGRRPLVRIVQGRLTEEIEALSHQKKTPDYQQQKRNPGNVFYLNSL